ncbi:glutamate receptor 2.7 [Dorcoceras hygrometricum]|uniref:Glutamate receptor 2.7 n=1 Tax=Dorcoceras hygrometricum TaxID=472368 RepID=A0A2Z7D221_9LAMI|nr:glutamate receptor 2.7 [Dorcoceras hygrometricum]
MGFLRQPALEGLTRSARTDSPRQDWPETIFRRAAATAATASERRRRRGVRLKKRGGDGYDARSTTGYETPSSACTRWPEETGADGLSSKDWPEQFPAKEEAAALGGGGGGFEEHCDVLSMQIDSDLVIYRTTLVRTFQVSTRSVLGKCVYLVTLAMSLFDLQYVRIAIRSIATLDLPMVVDLIGIYGLKGPYCTLTTTDWFLQALSVIPRGSWGDVARRFTMIRWAAQNRRLPLSTHAAAAAAADLRRKSVSGQFDEENSFVLISSVLIVQPDKGVSVLVVDQIGDYLPQSTEKSRVLVIPVGARHKCQQAYIKAHSAYSLRPHSLKQLPQLYRALSSSKSKLRTRRNHLLKAAQERKNHWTTIAKISNSATISRSLNSSIQVSKLVSVENPKEDELSATTLAPNGGVNRWQLVDKGLE